MTAPIVLFALAASGGLVMAFLRFSEKPIPMALAVLHGLAAAAGLLALASVVVGENAPELARIALGLFVLAALGGFFLFSFQLRGKPLPKPVVIIHGLVAVTAFVTLLLGVT